MHATNTADSTKKKGINYSFVDFEHSGVRRPYYLHVKKIHSKRGCYAANYESHNKKKHHPNHIESGTFYDWNKHGDTVHDNGNRINEHAEDTG